MTHQIVKFRGRWFFLSNFYLAEVEFEGTRYPSVENAFQAAKTLDRTIRKQFTTKTISPSNAKRMGRQILLRTDWSDVRVEIMIQSVRDKFTRHPELGSLLIGTKNRELIEGNDWGDVFWGKCNGRGKNILGRILMQVREELRASAAKRDQD